jgi:lipopolysaccharide export system protein LptA
MYMASSHHRAHRRLGCLLAGILVSWSGAAWTQTPLEEAGLRLDRTQPINLDAESSEFDRANGRLIFRGLRLSQGPLRVRADEAEASKLDFDNSLWLFAGNVLIEGERTTIRCDAAEVRFMQHELRTVLLSGAPAEFEQAGLEEESLTRGRARNMEYDVAGGTIRMSREAWLSDGANEVTGAAIAYDLNREFIIADSDESGQVRMRITPPQRDGAPAP